MIQPVRLNLQTDIPAAGGRPMQYQMRQKLFAWGDDFTIKNGNGQDTFFVDGKVFTLGNQLSFQDMTGRELALIKQKLLAWGPTYEIYREGQLAAVIKKELFTFFHCTFAVDVPGPDDLVAEGEFTDHEYAFSRGGKPAATVSKQWFTWTDSYGVDVNDGQDDLLILASTVVIDMACHADHHGRAHR
jgi:uncharacterized protein YxjI